ncbi:MAG: ribokinase [Firmicutes bacterium]|jgi:ribokinase|nr:ribokinase [Bacillota bacterium]
MKPILVVGSINVDYFIRMPRMPKAGESMVVERIRKRLGGKGANQALAVAKLGCPVEYIGMVGSDENGTFLRHTLREYGVSVECLLMSTRASTGMAIILLEDNGENRILVDKGANDDLKIADLEVILAPDKYSAVLLQLEIPLQTVSYVIRESQKWGLPVIVDAGPATSCDLSTFRGVDVLTPNQTETEALTGMPARSIDEAKAACAFLKAKTEANSIVLKMGSMGALSMRFTALQVVSL